MSNDFISGIATCKLLRLLQPRRRIAFNISLGGPPMHRQRRPVHIIPSADGDEDDDVCRRVRNGFPS